jgi:uncharacterized membrane protein
MNGYMTFILILMILALLDGIFIWLMKDIFQEQVQLIQNKPIKIKIMSLIICYLSLGFCLYYFIFSETKSDVRRVIDSIILGLLVYSIVETTNSNLFEEWKTTTMLIDILWGGILFGMTTYLVCLLQKVL